MGHEESAPPRDMRHGRAARLWVGRWTTVRYVHETPFWRAVHRSGAYLGGDEGGSSYRVGADLYVMAHTGTHHYYFVAPYHFAGR